MKLLHFRRFGFLCFATSLALTSGCFGVDDDDDDDDDDSCEVDDDCIGTRVCIDGECKRPSSGSGGTGATGGSGNNPGKGGTGGSGATGGSTGGTGSSTGGTGSSTGGTGSSTGGTSSSTGGTSSSTGGTGGTTPTTCTDADPIGCASSDEMILCTNGVPTVYSCSESCPQIGFEAVACVEGDGCCGGPIDPVCADGAVVYCTCSEMCTAEGDVIDVYLSCFNGEVNEDAFACIADYLDGDMVDCAGAEAACSGTAPPAPED